MSIFRFKHFSIYQASATMKVGTDAMILGALVCTTGKKRGLDIGAGTGVLSLMLAQRNVRLRIDALEIDQDASLGAKFNFDQSDWGQRLKSIYADILDYSSEEKYDLIFSNPPYYQDYLISSNDRIARAKHTSFLPIEKLISSVNSLLSEDGDFWIIVPANSGQNRWIKTCREAGLNLQKEIAIHGKEGDPIKRMIYCFSRNQLPLENLIFTVRSLDGSYTDEYINLTSEYHGIDLRG